MSRNTSKRRRQTASETEEDEPETSLVVATSTAAKRSRRSDSPDPDHDNENDSDSADDLDCSQPELKSNTNLEAEVGIIERITLVNFMCHTMLEVPLGSNVNFIIGRNGSGKSAIMTAIVVGLGGKANATSRGSSLKNFIKDKCSFAQIIIKLRNRGQDAYCPEVYGKSIIVERRISSDGGSGYKIKSHDGKTISTKKEELIHIMDQFGIQVDNPVSVLNQDTSRNFLNSSDPKDKYKFFLKATQLDQMSMDYQVVIEEQDVIKNTLNRKQETLPEMKKLVQKLEEKYKDLAQLKTMKEQVEELKKERVWAEVVELEKKLRPLQQVVQDTVSRKPRYQEKIDEAVNNIQELEVEWQSIQESVNLVTEEMTKVQEEQSGIVADLKTKKTACRGKQSNLRKLKEDLNSTQHEEKELVDRIREIRQTAMRDLETERNQRQSELQSKREELEANQRQLQTTSHHREQLERAISREKEKSYGLRTDISDAGRSVDQIQRNLRNLTSSRSNRMRIFGAYVPELLNKIKQNRRQFHHLPVGPIGGHLTLRDQKWALSVESCIKGLAWAFCCHDNHDEQALKRIMHDVCPKNTIPQIIISKFQERYDVSEARPRCNYTTVLDELVIDNPVVANCLIDQVGVETVLLIEDPREARDFMFSRPPPGVRMAYAGNGDQLIGGRSAKSYAAMSTTAKYLQQDIEQEIRRLEHDLQSKQDYHRQLLEQQRQSETIMNDNQKELKRSRTKAMREQEIVNRLINEITELENYEEEELPDLTTLEEERASYTEQVQELENQVANAESEFEKAQEAYQKQEIKYKNHRDKIQEVMGKHDPLKEKQDEVMRSIATEKNNKKHYERKCKEVDDAVKKAETELGSMQKIVQDTTDLANQYCERVDTRRSVRSLETEIIQKERRIQTEENNHGKHEEITRKYYEAKMKFEETKSCMKNLLKYKKRLEDVLKKRSAAYIDYRKFIAIRAKFFFQMMLSQRGYTGKMKFDHGNERLEIEVNVELALKKANKDTKSLSGGERSFSTICFIMSLWEAMETPFRCLDEFDVFMDMVNRRISMTMMLKVAKEQSERQFILLTPQDMTNIGGGSSVRYFKLRDPERGQLALNFGQAEQDTQ
ncbi:structural maintenance of chromosomes protein 6 [Exaiptasia diaphana]|uniref:Structural maintenance of chromosomes protein 6 n=1 Tax=Exaiptasia diaphana TaxID=2652724 RepID=A0A913XZH0_EXADI|nr:structural maintenance of chromosomes protein 6 [Exaiptasia diaphana]